MRGLGSLYSYSEQFTLQTGDSDHGPSICAGEGKAGEPSGTRTQDPILKRDVL